MIEIIRTILLVRIMRIIILRATIITNITQGQTNSERETLFGLIRPTLKAQQQYWQIFLNLIDQQFPQDRKFHKIFNRNNMKVSYSCMQNVKSAISSHKRERKTGTCNFTRKMFNRKYIYKSNISSENHLQKICCSVSETKFETR